MATVRKFEVADATGVRPHGEVKASARLIELAGEKFIQLDTYGSADRQEVGKLSQSIRLDEAAYRQLVERGSEHF